MATTSTISRYGGLVVHANPLLLQDNMEKGCSFGASFFLWTSFAKALESDYIRILRFGFRLRLRLCGCLGSRRCGRLRLLAGIGLRAGLHTGECQLQLIENRIHLVDNRPQLPLLLRRFLRQLIRLI